MTTYAASGIILQHRNFREADRLLILYTEEFGKVQVVARGARKITSKLAGSLEPFNLVDFSFVRGRLYNTVIEVEVINIFQELKTNEQKILLASYITDILARVLKEYQRDGRIFHLLKSSLQTIQTTTSQSIHRSKIVWFFIWQLLRYLGYQPELYSCIICHKRLSTNKNYFTLSKGGIVCDDCQAEVTIKVPVSQSVIKLLRVLTEKSRTDLDKLAMNRSVISEMDNLTTSYLNYTQEEEYSPRDFLFAV